MIMVTFSSSNIKPPNASAWVRERLPLIGRRIVLPLAILALLFFMDYPLRAIVRGQESPFLNHFFSIVKYAGSFVVGFCLALVLIGVGKYANKDRLLRAGRLMLLSLIAANIVVLIAKPVLNIHPRNDMVSVAQQDPSATRWGRFPSGDTTIAFSVAASLVAEFPPLLIPLYAIGFLVGVERVYFNLHFFSDVFAGAWLGIVMVNLVRKKYFSPTAATTSHIATRDSHP